MSPAETAPVHTIGIDIGGTSIRAGVVTERGAVIDTARAATLGATGPGAEHALESAIASCVQTLRHRHTVAGVGMGVAGFLTADRSLVRFAPHLPWRNAPVADRMSRRLGLPVGIEHDANAAALAEHRFGVARGCGTVVLLALGTGIGAALLINGALFRGGHGVAPELGHLQLVPDGRACPCGRRGCWERYCSGTALVDTTLAVLAEDGGRAGTRLAQLAQHDPGSLTGRRVAAAARQGDALALRAMAELADWLAEGLCLVADVYDPEMIVIGGGVSGSGALFLDRARQRYARSMTGAGYRPPARIRCSELSDNAGIVGTATLIREQLGETGGQGR